MAEVPRPSPDRFDVDGVAVALRRVRPTDAGRVERFFRGLSALTAHRRFHAPRRALTSRELAAIVHVDHEQRETLLVTEASGCRVLAIGQYIALKSDRAVGAVADVALVVDDAWQGRGLGRLLGRRLLGAAREAGFTAVTASVLADNRPALALFDRLDPATVAHAEGNAVEFLIHLHGE